MRTEKAGDSPRLKRQLGLGDAVTLGMGSMIGAGIFVVLGPASAAAGSSLLLGLGLAAAAAYANATSSAQLAAVYPGAGGTFLYGRERLGAFWGFIAGWGFVVGKTASLAVMALTVGTYVAPGRKTAFAVAAVLAATAINASGIRKTAWATRATISVVLASLAVVFVAGLTSDEGSMDAFADFGRSGPYEVLQAAALLFFAFAGYARIATLGEEVIDPSRTIPKAIPLALTITLVVYGFVAFAALFAVGPSGLATSEAPLALVAGRWGLVARIGAAVAALGVLLSLLAGVSRTVFAMARARELPEWLAAVHPRNATPLRAEIAIGLLVAAVTAFTDLRGAIGFSSFTVLVYYAITNVCAFTQPLSDRRWPKALQIFGVLGSLLLAFTLPIGSVIGGVSVLVAGASFWRFARRR